VPAWVDNDSPDAPIASVIFESAGTQILIYNGDVSSPQGDMEDWIAYKPYDQFVLISLECQGSDSLEVEMTENSLPMSTYISCSDPVKQFAVKPGSNYLLHIQAAPATDGLQYTNYILTIKTRP
jgi:hypothetical protein